MRETGAVGCCLEKIAAPELDRAGAGPHTEALLRLVVPDLKVGLEAPPEKMVGLDERRAHPHGARRRLPRLAGDAAEPARKVLDIGDKREDRGHRPADHHADFGFDHGLPPHAGQSLPTLRTDGRFLLLLYAFLAPTTRLRSAHFALTFGPIRQRTLTPIYTVELGLSIGPRSRLQITTKRTKVKKRTKRPSWPSWIYKRTRPTAAGNGSTTGRAGGGVGTSAIRLSTVSRMATRRS